MVTKVRQSTLDASIAQGPPGISGGIRQPVPSATTLNLSSLFATTQNLQITGTVAITGVTIANGQTFFLSFTGVCTLVNSGALVTNKGANIVTVSGDSCILRAIGDNVAEIICYCRGSAV